MNNKDFNEGKPVPLNMVEPGTEVKLASIEGGMNLHRRLTDMGLKKGSRFSIMKTMGPGPCVIQSGESRLALGVGMASKILVQKAE